MTAHGFGRRWLGRAALGGAASVLGADWLGAALAQPAGGEAVLRIGMAAPNTTLDPHLQSNAPNNAVTSHVFDALVTNDAASSSVPGLAESWRLLADARWEFALRRGVRFTDGTPFTAEDVIASVHRATELPSTASFRTYTRSVKAMAAPDPHTLVVETDGPDPLLANSLSRIRVIAARHAGAASAAFNGGAAAIGTGAFLLREYVPGSHLRLARNPDWWGGALPWQEVVLRIVTDDGARLAALLAGDLDIIEAVPSQGAARIAGSPRHHLVRGISSRFVYLGFDHGREQTPYATGADGRPLPRNPFRDLRVRQAVNLAISRQAMVERVMEGDAVAASQFLPKGRPGTSARLEVPPFDPARARALLAAAGYPNGFRLTVHGPNDRYVNDAKVVQAVAQMLTRIGIQASAEVMPWSVYASRGARNEFSLQLGAWGANTGETSNPLKGLLATWNRETGMGAANAGRYSNPELDRRLAEALRSMDDARRNALLAEASEIAFDDVALVPLHHEVSVWGARRGITTEPRNDQYTLAMGVTRS